MPCLTMLVLPWAASMEVRNINLAVVDNDRSAYSGRLTEKASASAYFNLVDVASSYEEAMKGVESGQTDIILEIPEKFERRLTSEGAAQVLIAANAVNGTKGAGQFVPHGHRERLLGRLAQRNRRAVSDFGRAGRSDHPAVQVQPAFELPSLYGSGAHGNAADDRLRIHAGAEHRQRKEIGTIEQINVSPVGKFQFILAKLIPYWVIGFVVLSISFVLAWLVYGLVPAGNLLTIYAGMALYVLTVSGLGLLVSNTSDTMQQAMFVMFFFMIVLILMSGLFTPISSMPGWAQKITLFNPLRYFIQIMRMVYLKGSGFADLLTQFSALAVFTVTINLWAVLSYRKNR